MAIRAVALLSGGLDSMLAVRIMQEQGIEIEGVNFKTQFACCRETASHAARLLGVRLTILDEDDAYLNVIRRPRFGYGRGANPCVDCRIFMFSRARELMDRVGASFVISGEVLGQRPMSQKRRDLMAIARHSGLEDRLLRPLSARLLPPTFPEQTGDVDRTRLYSFSGQSRKGLIALARQFGFPETDIPSPSTGCMLTQQSFAPRVFDLVRFDPDNTAWDFALLKVGRHVRFDSQTKIVVGRRQAENDALRGLAARHDARAAALLYPDNFTGPTALVAGPATDETLRFAGGLILRYAHHAAESPQVVVESADGTMLISVERHHEAEAVATL